MPFHDPNIRKIPFTLCANSGATQSSADANQQNIFQAVANWDDLGIKQIIVGESNLPAHPQRTQVADVRTTANDEPQFCELLRCAELLTADDWLLLVQPEILLSNEFIFNLSTLCSTGNKGRLMFGGSWSLEKTLLNQLLNTSSEITKLIDNDGILSPADQPGWIIFPRGMLQSAPIEIPANPIAALHWLLDCANILNWATFDCTAIAPVAKPIETKHQTKQGTKNHKISQQSSTRIILPSNKGAPRLSILLAAPEALLPKLQEKLCSTSSLPWEVICRPADPEDGFNGITTAWNSALASARSNLAWPITAALPKLALLPVILRRMEMPGADLLLLSWCIGLQQMPARDSWHQEPGCLVAQTAWLHRVGGFKETVTAASSLLLIRNEAERRGATCAILPLNAHQKSSES